VNRNPDSAGKPDNKVPQHKKASWWRDGRTIVPIGISVVALVFAGLTYVDQRNVDLAAATASQEAYARLVSYYQSTNGSSTMVVANLGQQPIFNVQAQIWLVSHGGTASQQQLTATFETAELPPCSDTMVNFHDPGFLASLEEYSTGNAKLLFKKLESSPNGWFTIPSSLVFVDVNNRTWEINAVGQLTQVASSTYLTPVGVDSGHTARTTPAQGCTSS